MRYIFSTDHKVIGSQFLLTALALLFVGGLISVLLCAQQVWALDFPFGAYLPRAITMRVIAADGAIFYQLRPEFYYMLSSLHASVMIMFVLLPCLLGVLVNWAIPTAIGSDKLALPRLNCVSFWCLVAAIVVMIGAVYSSIVYPYVDATVEGDFAASLAAAKNISPAFITATAKGCFIISILLFTISTIAGALNCLASVLILRDKSVAFGDLPMTVWALSMMSTMLLLLMPVFAAIVVMALIDNFMLAIWWNYSYVVFYVMILPAFGVIADSLAAYSGKPVFAYKSTLVCLFAIALLGTIVYVLNVVAGDRVTIFVWSAILFLPLSIMIFNYFGNLWGGQIRLTVSMLYALVAVFMFVAGVLGGLLLCLESVREYLPASQFMIAHLHYVLFGCGLFAVFSAVDHYFPKVFSQPLNSFWGYVHLVLSFIFFNMTFAPMYALGMTGHLRNVIGQSFDGTQQLNEWIAWSALCLCLTQIILFFNVIRSMKCKDCCSK